jgi:hypothetical protein
MRLAAPFHSVVPLALAAALVAIPAAPQRARAQVTLAGEPAPTTPVRMAGVYRVVLSSYEMATQRMHLLVRLESSGYTCVLLSGDKETPLSDIQLEGDVIRGLAATSFGQAKVVLTITDEGVSGTLTVGRTRMAIKGERIG